MTPWTCGQGLAANASLPAGLGAVAAAMGENLDLHTRALLGADPDTQREREVYATIAGALRDAGALLATAAARMAAASDLAMGPHDMAAMHDPRMRDAFRRLLDAERELAATIAARLAQDERMLDEMSLA